MKIVIALPDDSWLMIDGETKELLESGGNIFEDAPFSRNPDAESFMAMEAEKIMSLVTFGLRNGLIRGVD